MKRTCPICGCVWDDETAFKECPVCRLHRIMEESLQDLEDRIEENGIYLEGY